MDAGRLRERVRIETPARTQDERGQEQPGTATLCEVWACVEAGVVREAWQGRGVQATGDEVVTVRHREDVAAAAGTLRVVVLTQGNRVLNVEGARRDPARRWLYLDCAAATEGPAE